MNLTNQELIQELQKRVKEGKIEMEVTADQFKKETNSLFSYLGTKELLILVGLTAVAALAFCQIITVTGSYPTGYTLEFDHNPSITTISPEVQKK